MFERYSKCNIAARAGSSCYAMHGMICEKKKRECFGSAQFAYYRCTAHTLGYMQLPNIKCILVLEHHIIKKTYSALFILSLSNIDVQMYKRERMISHSFQRNCIINHIYGAYYIALLLWKPI